MPEFVLDVNVLIADLVERQDDNQFTRAQSYLAQVRSGSARAHIPSMMLVELCSGLFRELQNSDEATVLAAEGRKRLGILNKIGNVIEYDLDVRRANQAGDMAIRYGLSGADAIHAQLSEELALNLVTFDERTLAERLRRGGYTRVVVPT